MTDAALALIAARAADRDAFAKRLKKRRASEARFKAYGLAAISVAIAFLVILLGDIIHKGLPAFTAWDISVPVYVDPARVDRADLAGANYDQLVANAVLKQLGEVDDEMGDTSLAAQEIISNSLGFQLLEKLRANPDLIGKTVTLKGPVRADAALYYKGELDKGIAEDDRKLKDRQMAWLDKLKAKGVVHSSFNTAFFTRSDSTEPEQAGVLGAVVGSLLILFVTAILAVPVGVAAAVYLEEFAPKNRWTGFIEVNINNLAAVPSIIYGLLGLAFFIQWIGVPRSSPLVGGLVLFLMALPTIIIATRSALKSVPPSIREAALGVGASHNQTVFHHVLPLAVPGIMTGTILSLAHALGETAPLLMIGMVSFMSGVPKGFLDASTALPVQVFIWENASERAFHERTAAAILVLVGFMILMNLAAVILRRRFERRW
jgi:phosphate transport system permease protein